MKQPAKKIYQENKDGYQEALLNVNKTEYQLEMLEYAHQNSVPIMQPEGIAFLVSLLEITKPTRILEIGSAIGYSSSFMALNSNAIIDTIEKDDKMYELCVKNHSILGISNKVNVIHGDALETFDMVKNNTYDLIFIDAAKAQYIKFFELYEPLLKTGGIILTDNLYFHDLLFEQIENRDLRQLVRKVGTYNDYLLGRKDYNTHIFTIGDGVGVSVKK